MDAAVKGDLIGVPHQDRLDFLKPASRHVEDYWAWLPLVSLQDLHKVPMLVSFSLAVPRAQ